MLDQISIFLENKPGRLAAVMKVLKDAGTDLRAFTIADTTDFGIVRIIATDTDKALKALKDNDFTATANKILGVTIPDHPGELYKIIEMLQETNVNIEYSYSFMGSRPNEADIAIRTQNNEAAEQVLKTKGIKLLG